MTAPIPRFDLLLVGGGLANGLIAFRLAERRPDLRILVLEAGASAGGNHTWSFHESDLTPSQQAWTKPFVACRWPFYHVAFPDLRRRVDLPYASVTSDRFRRTLAEAGVTVRTGAKAVAITPRGVELQGGEHLEAAAVIDGRGASEMPHLRLGWQKFLGREVRTAHPHRVIAPVIMDATVSQHDGYRFVYVLPFAEDRLLIEDTYYSDSPALHPDALAGRIVDYAHDNGWVIAETLREERGVLPITLAGDFDAFWSAKAGQPCAGLRAGLFHPTTGFSWPDAVRLADQIAALPRLDAAPLFRAIRAAAKNRWREQTFFRGLDRMLFLAGEPASRWAMLRRFYCMDEALIARFYAGHLWPRDQARLLLGKPPVSVTGALRALFDTRVTLSR